MKKFSRDQRLALYKKVARRSRKQNPADIIRSAAAVAAHAKRREAQILQAIFSKLERGSTLASAFAGTVPRRELVFIHVGESNGTLATALGDLVTLLETERARRIALFKALSMPAVLLTVVLLFLYGAGAFLMPELADMYAVVAGRVPVTDSFYVVSTWFSRHAPFVAVAAVATIAVVVVSIDIAPSAWRARLDALPPWSIFRDDNALGFMRMLQLLNRSGVPLGEALKMVGDDAGPWLRGHITAMLENLDQTSSISEVMNTGMLNDETLFEIADMPPTEELEEALEIPIGGLIEQLDKRNQNIARFGSLTGILLTAGFILWLMGAISFMALEFTAQVGV